VGEISRRARVLLIAAHPDDETLGAGGLLWRLSSGGAQIAVAHATDGAPENMTDAVTCGFATREAYAAARDQEVDRALQSLPRQPQRFRLGYVDQSLVFHLPAVTKAVAELLQTFAPTLVLSHSYEGGHPDHDCVALAVAAALRRTELPGPARHVEFASYHLWNGATRAGVFLHDDASTTVFELDDETRQAKERMLRCFETQRETLGSFDAGPRERFRPAPGYDFRRPPHAPPVLYDLYRWGVTSNEWLTHAAALLDAEAPSCR
jgi:N-acetylglucosamine malate deacetylase 2